MNNLTFGDPRTAPLMTMLDELISKISQADVVSFDVFDTLFVRPVASPEDAFDILGERFGIENFRGLRQQAQARAFQVMHERGQREITLDGIYECFESPSAPAAVLRDAEFELELELTVPNPRLIDIFREAVSRKPVVVTSDMYLPRAFFDALFARHGLAPSAIFISSERNATKRDHGELFDIVARHMQVAPRRILHVGDNPVSDIERAKQRGLATFHYVDAVHVPAAKAIAPATSLATGLIRAVSESPEAGSFTELGFRFGGPAAVGFLDWIASKAKRDRIDFVLFVSRDGYALERLASAAPSAWLPKFAYFKGSRVAFTLAATDEGNFDTQLAFLLSGCDALSPFEVLERIGVTPPSDSVMRDFGLGPEVQINGANMTRMREFLSAYRSEVLRVCRKARRGLFQYLNEVGIERGMRVAMIDVGWNGTTQEAFDRALRKITDIELYGYYLCLTDFADCVRRRGTLRMDALLSSESIARERVERVYANRVAIELFFSAPHDAVIGYEPSDRGPVGVLEDPGRVPFRSHAQISQQIVDGIERFAEKYGDLCRAIGLVPDPLSTALPVVNFVETIDAKTMELLASIDNFDAWASTRNNKMSMSSYITR
jgi:predicted HAD superfamily hydrolase